MVSQETSAKASEEIRLAEAVRIARTAYTHARQRCAVGQGSQAEYEKAKAALESAKAALTAFRGEG